MLTSPDAIRHREELPALFKSRGYVVGAEVGVQAGKFASCLLTCLPDNGQLYLIDAWEHREGYDDSSNVNQTTQDVLYADVKHLFFGDPRVRIQRDVSPTAAEIYPDNYFDFVYIDADHSEQAVTADLEAWWPTIRPGGMMAGHDYLDGRLADGLFGVKTAVDRFAAKHGLTVHVTPGDISWPTWMLDKPGKNVLYTVAAGERYLSMARMLAASCCGPGEFKGRIIIFTDDPQPATGWEELLLPADLCDQTYVFIARASVVRRGLLGNYDRALYVDADCLVHRPLECLFASMPAIGFAHFGEHDRRVSSHSLFRQYLSDEEIARHGDSLAVSTGVCGGRRSEWNALCYEWDVDFRVRAHPWMSQDQPILNRLVLLGLVRATRWPDELIGYPRKFPVASNAVVQHYTPYADPATIATEFQQLMNATAT